MPYTTLSLGAQTSYAELFDMAQTVAAQRFAAPRGSFQRRLIRGKTYVYFHFRDVDGQGRAAYVGPDNARVSRLVAEVEASNVAARDKALSQRAQACVVLGCAGMPGGAVRIVRKLAGYGFFRTGGVLVGPLALAALGNVLGVRWTCGTTEGSGDNVAIGFPARMEVPALDAITALELGQLPIREFAACKVSRRGQPVNLEFRVDFLTPDVGDGADVEMPSIGLPLKPSQFLELLLEDTVQGVAFGQAGACLVTLPDPARYAIHQLLVSASISERAKSAAALEQAAALVEWSVDHGRQDRIREVVRQTLQNKPSWHQWILEGAASLAAMRPPLARVLE